MSGPREPLMSRHASRESTRSSGSESQIPTSSTSPATQSILRFASVASMSSPVSDGELEDSLLISETEAGDEDFLDWEKYRSSYYVLAFLSLADTIDYGVVMPSLFNFVQNLEGDKVSDTQLNHDYGLILSSFSFASMICKPLLGYLADKRPYSETFIWSTCIAMVGNLMYMLGDYLCKEQGWSATGALLTARMLCGIGCANTALTFSYLARTAPPKERTKYISLLSMAKVGGLVFGPVLNALTSQIDFSVGDLHVDQYSSPGLVIAIVNSILIIVLAIFLVEPPPYIKPEAEEPGLLSDGVALNICSLPLALTFFNVLSANFIFGALEAFIVPTTWIAFHWNPLQNSCVYLAMTGVALTTSIFVMKYSKSVEDRVFLVLAGFFSILGPLIARFLFFYDMGNAPFWIGMVAWTMPLSLAFPPNRSLFTRLLEKSRWQGLWSSVLSIFSSLGGLLGPLWVGLTLGERPASHAERTHERVAPISIDGCLALGVIFLSLNIFVLFMLPTNEPILVHRNDATIAPDSDQSSDDAEAQR